MHQSCMPLFHLQGYSCLGMMAQDTGKSRVSTLSIRQSWKHILSGPPSGSEWAGYYNLMPRTPVSDFLTQPRLLCVHWTSVISHTHPSSPGTHGNMSVCPPGSWSVLASLARTQTSFFQEKLQSVVIDRDHSLTSADSTFKKAIYFMPMEKRKEGNR